MNDDFIRHYLRNTARILRRLEPDAIEKVVRLLAKTRRNRGRLFLLGVGGSAANCSHAVNDFRKLCGMEAYAPTDNVSELTARTNDEGWASVFVEWLRVSHLSACDLVFILSVGGGDADRNVSPNLVRAIDYARSVGAAVAGVVGRDGGYTAKQADACIRIPPLDAASVTPHTEAFQAVICHLLVSHPALAVREAKWESVASASSGRTIRKLNKKP